MRRALVTALLTILVWSSVSGSLHAIDLVACQFTAEEAALAQTALQRLRFAQVVSGLPATMDQTSSSWSRAQFAVVLAKGLGLRHEAEENPPPSPFSDLQGHWAAGYVAVLHRQGLVTGYPGGAFRPDDGILLAEAKVMLARSLRLGAHVPLSAADAMLRWGGVDPGVPCSYRKEATAGQIYLLLDRALSVPLYARLPEAPMPWVLDLDRVVLAKRTIGLADRLSETFDPQTESDLKSLARLMEWLKTAVPADGEISRLARGGPILMVELKDGSHMRVILALNCVTEESAGIRSIACKYAEGEVIAHLPAGDAVRLRAPELAAWLINGWSEEG